MNFVRNSNFIELWPGPRWNSFFWDISDAIIAYAKDKDAKRFIETVLQVKRIADGAGFDNVSHNTALSSAFERLLQSTEDFYYETRCFDCQCPRGYDTESEQYQQAFANYVAQVVGAYQLCYQEFLGTLPACSVPGFADDFKEIEQVLTQTHDLAQAEKALSFWEGAVKDDTLRSALIGLRYVYYNTL